jgi:hypothetical protein
MILVGVARCCNKQMLGILIQNVVQSATETASSPGIV